MSKKWKEGEELQGTVTVANRQVILTARLLNRVLKQVEFSWSDEEIAFVDLVEACGETPLPPYLNRKAQEEDKSRYQTVYSEKEGAVAAPTAGLHFTEETFSRLRKKGNSRSCTYTSCQRWDISANQSRHCGRAPHAQ